MNFWLKIGKVALVLVLGLSLAGQWGLMQSAAWASMFIRFIQTDSFCTALAKTFDGRHPCALCLKIRDGQREENRKSSHHPQEKPEKMPELFCDADSFTVPLAPQASMNVPTVRLDRYSEFFESPPKPPPRIALAVL